MTDKQDDILPVMEEQVSVTAQRQVRGRVRVTTRTETLEASLPVDLSEVNVEVTRVPVDRAVDHQPDVVTDGDLTIVPVVEERLVVTRQLFVREEIHIRRTEHHETVDVPVTTRRQVADIDRVPVDDDAASSPSHPDKDTEA